MPNRIIKESICTSDSIDGLTWFEEVLFYRLIVNCDDYGRFDGRPAIIKNRLFPLKESLTARAVSEAINRLVSAGMVALYEFEGKPYLYLPTWNCHQSVRAKRSKYPSPDEASQSNDADTEQHENICRRQGLYDIAAPYSKREEEQDGLLQLESVGLRAPRGKTTEVYMKQPETVKLSSCSQTTMTKNAGFLRIVLSKRSAFAIRSSIGLTTMCGTT